MSKRKINIKWSNILCVCVLCLATLVLEFAPVQLSRNERRNEWIATVVGQGLGLVTVLIVMRWLAIKPFVKPQHVLYLLPCLLIAINNFPFWSYFQGNMRFTHATIWNIVWFASNCLVIGMFEECIFRGLLFSTIAGCFSDDRKGLIKTFFLSSILFGGAHIFNIFGGNIGATLLQVVYSTLTGGLFAFVLMKTKNIVCCGITHALYNFCGLLLSEKGLGLGVVFDFGTTVTMAIVAIGVGVFVLYSVYRYAEEERNELYRILNIKQ